ncbi:Ig-like domain-containing protein [Rhodoferax ferrireducens]|uniref:Ig-like domain-containing protein n=1 Tax=Rhodoferax ferrireducens TaxID=192843 RepID=UPI0013005375|nr:Ig-like domain-containing protein [Rhodoferax ferrireducens]
MNLLKYGMGLVVAMALTACGGGGGNASAPLAAASGSTPSAASFVFTLDKSSISNTGSDKAVLTVTALDVARNVVSGIPLAVSVDSGVYTAIVATTDATGQASGSISIGGNKANRNITATINVGGKTGSAVIAVTGSQISLTPLPATPGPGVSVQVVVKATDVNGVGIGGATVQLGGTLGFTQSVTTDPSGNVTAILGAVPSISGTYTVAAAGLGVTALRDVQVVGGSGGIPNAAGSISAATLAVTPNTIFPNLSGGTSNRAGIRAVFLDSSNQAIQNVRVRFEIVAPGLGSGEQVSTAAATVYSDASGVAIADYIAGTRTSPTNGVTIRACYGNTDADIAMGTCVSSRTATLTVAGQPLSITLGDNNELAKGGNNLTYIKLFDVAVADSAGNAVPNAIVSASVDLMRYGKGLYSAARLWCANEDANRNGFLESIEDLDGNGILSPRKADVILSFTGTNTTGANGRTTIQVEYPQNVATWLDYSVRVTTNVAGSEGTAVKSYFTTFIIGDDANGSFLTPPFGINSCSTAN